jgi:hypothetical protein
VIAFAGVVLWTFRDFERDGIELDEVAVNELRAAEAQTGEGGREAADS